MEAVHNATTSTNYVSSICSEPSSLSFNNNRNNDDIAIVHSNQVLIESITESDNVLPPSSLIKNENNQTVGTIKTQVTAGEIPQKPRLPSSSSSSMQVVLVGMNNISESNNKSIQQKRHGDDSMHSDSIYTSKEKNNDDEDSKQPHSLGLGTSEEIEDIELGTRSKGKRKNNINTSFEDDIIVSDDDTYDAKLQKRYQQLHHDVASGTPPTDSDLNNGEKKPVDADSIELQQYFENSLLHGNVHSISLINSDYESTAENENDASFKRSDSDQNHKSNRSYPDNGSLVHMMSSLSDENEIKDHTINVDKKTIANHPSLMECALSKNELYDGKVDKSSARRIQSIVPIMMILSIFVVVVVSFVLARFR